MQRWLAALLPRACPGCGTQLGRESGLCPACRANLHAQVVTQSTLTRQVTPHLVTLGPYRGTLRRSIRALKYGGARDLAGILAQALAAEVPATWQVKGVIPVPLHPRRQRERGYNQAALLAEVIAAELSVSCLPLLTRTRYTSAQAKKHAADRGHLEGAFRLAGTPPPGTLLLVDDVLTTGATLTACRNVLLAAGVPEPHLKYAVIAR